MKTLEELGLSRYEIDFVQLVYLNQGCKLYNCTVIVYDESKCEKEIQLYKKPEQLGLIECIGSYKWKITDKIKMMLVADL